MLRFILLALFGLSLLTQCRRSDGEPVELYSIDRSVREDSAMVVSAHPLSSDIGANLMRRGGNAIDAAVGVQFALAVVQPRAGNIGGGGFMVIRMANGETAAIDYREKAPLAANRDMYLDENGDPVDSLSRQGHLAVGVPGSVDGLLRAHERYGKLPLSEVVAPAVRLAREGYRITEAEVGRLNGYKDVLVRLNKLPMAFVKEETWELGDRLVQEDLAQTLERIQQNGREGFYAGKTADLIVAEMERGGGLITKADLANYEAQWRDPIIGEYKDYRIISMPPPSSGGVALVQILGMLEPYRLNSYGFHSPLSIHTIAEAERRAYADRATHLGDPDFYPVPVDSLLRKAYLFERMSDFNPQRATVSDSLIAGAFHLSVESFETTHTSVVDPAGNAVSVTTTLNLSYGSKVVVHGGGFLLNDEMDDFSAKPGVPNYFGLVGNEANSIQPGKRMLSSMTPTIVERDGQLFMVVGAPGGSTIITAVAQTLLNVIEYGMPLDSAVNAARFHHQWLPDQILYEKTGFDESTLQALRDMGHELKEVNRMAIIKAIQRLPNGMLHGASDARNPDDDVEGF